MVNLDGRKGGKKICHLEERGAKKTIVQIWEISRFPSEFVMSSSMQRYVDGISLEYSSSMSGSELPYILQ